LTSFSHFFCADPIVNSDFFIGHLLSWISAVRELAVLSFVPKASRLRQRTPESVTIFGGPPDVGGAGQWDVNDRGVSLRLGDCGHKAGAADVHRDAAQK
jgi:hypothetical protein